MKSFIVFVCLIASITAVPYDTQIASKYTTVYK